MGRVIIFTVVITIALFGILIEAAQYLQQQNASFYCDFPDIPVVWDFESGIYSHHETLAFLDTSGRFYVDSAAKYKLEKEGYGTRLTIYNLALEDEGVYACKKFYNQSAKQEFPIEMVVTPDLFQIDQDHSAEKGDLYTLACVADHIKPTPKIWWQMQTVDGQLIDMSSSSVLSVLKYRNSSTKVISSVGVQLNRTIQGAKFICHTELQTSELGVVYRNTTQAHTVNALFKPLTPQIYGLDGTLIGGMLYTLRCVAGYANPAAEISWFKDGRSWSASRVDVSSFIGYYVTTSYLEINATHLVDNSTFTCSVTNALMRRDRDAPFIVTKVAHVEYTPIIGAWIHNKTVSEGEPFELDCAVKFAKPIAYIRWIRNGHAVDLTDHSRFLTFPYPSTKWTSLTVNNATWQDVGAWQCEASNAAGAVASDLIYVNVEHRPYCTQNVTYVSADLGDTATLTCTVNSNPNDNVSISWYFNDKQVTSKQQKVETLPDNDYIAYQTISVQASSESDFGSFYCSAENVYGETPYRCEIQLLHKEDKLDTPALISAAFGGEAQSYVIITCLVVAFLVIVVFIIGVVIMKRRGSSNNEKETADSEENYSNTNPNIHMTKASGEGANNNAYNKPSEEGTPEHLVNQELQEVVMRSKKQNNPDPATAEICKSNVEQLPSDAQHHSNNNSTTEGTEDKPAQLNQNDPPAAVLVRMRNLGTDQPSYDDPSHRNSTQSQAMASLRGSITCSIDNLNDLVERMSLPDVYDVEDASATPPSDRVPTRQVEEGSDGLYSVTDVGTGNEFKM